ncbi:MAG: TonB-dependent receptor [Rhodocyclaceae bacterium]|nr:TonB-dependent receptor [Rhodocyclaceae bacterium]
MKMQKVLLSSAALLLACQAQSAEQTLQDIVIRARKERPPVGVTIEKDTLGALRPATSDTASLLRDVPGVSLYGAGGVSSLPAIHGLADERIRLTVDGMDLYAACPNHMNTPLSYLDPSSVAAASLWAGIAPVSAGGDALGGVIQIDSPPPLFASPGQGRFFTGEVGAFYRSNGGAYGANVAVLHATEAFSLGYRGAFAEADNYRAGGTFKERLYANPANAPFTGRAGHTLPLDEVGSTAYRTRNHILSVAWRNTDQLIEAKAHVQDMPYQLYPNQRMDLLGNESYKLNLRYLASLAWGTLDLRLWHEKVEHYMDFGADKRFWYGLSSGGPSAINAAPCTPISASCAAGMPMYTQSMTDGVKVKGDVALSSNRLLRLGAEWHRFALDDWWPPSGGGMWPGTFWNIRDGVRSRLAFFGELENQLSPTWLALAGLRYEYVKTNAGQAIGYNPNGGGNQGRDANLFNARDHKRAFNNWDMTVVARYMPHPTFELEFGFAHKERAPGLYELYPWSTWQMAALMNNFVGDGNGYIGNLDLKAEKANTLSATFDWHDENRFWEFKATPFYTRVANYIDAIQWDATANAPRVTPITNNFTVLKYVNQSARLHGIDLSGKILLGKTHLGEFDIKGVLNYTRGKNLESGDDLYNIMPLHAKLSLAHRVGKWDNALEVVLVKGKDNVSDVRNEIKTPGYGLVNVRASHSWKQARLDFGIENLFDRLYFHPTGGAYLGQGTTMTIGAQGVIPQWGTAVPGPGRSLYASLRYTF